MQGPVGVGGQTGLTLAGSKVRGGKVTALLGCMENQTTLRPSLARRVVGGAGGKWVTRMDGHRQMGEFLYGRKATRQLGVSGWLGGMIRQTHGSASSLWEGLTHSAGTGEGCR